LTVRSFIVLLYWQALTLHKGFWRHIEV
jgi:hypothetical protein